MKTKELMSFIFPYLKRYKLDYSILFVFILVGILLQPGIAWFFQNMTNSIFDGGENNLVMYLIVGILLIITIVITNYLNSYYIAKTTSKVKKDVRTDLFQHLLKLPMSFIVSTHSGNLQSRIHQDTGQLDGVLGHNIAQFIIIPISGVVSFMYLAFISLPLALITLILGPLILLVSKSFGVVIRNNGEVIQEQVAKMSRQLQETYDGHTIIKVFGVEKALTKKYTTINDDLLKLQIKEGSYSAILQAISIGISYCSQIMVFAIGTFFVANKQITVGDLLAFIVLSQALITPFSNMGHLWTELQRSLSAVQRIYDMLHLPIATDFKKEDVGKLPVQITFDNVSFAYEEHQQVLQNINLQIKPSERVAIIGESGSGKTTLMKLLLGLYRPTNGNIYLQPEGEKKEELEGLNPYTTYVPQDAFLFDDTIHQNIHYGNLNAPDDEVLTAAKRVSADSFIQNLKGEYDFQVGERGNQLSGGQRQRITLARAFIAEKSLIVFDEATSALDIQTEEFILQQQFELQRDYQSLLMITHRLSAAKYCDKIILLRNGIINAQGTHDELLASSDYYKELYQQYIDANTRTTVDENETL